MGHQAMLYTGREGSLLSQTSRVSQPKLPRVGRKRELRPDSQIMIIPSVQLQDVLCAMLSLSMRLGIVVYADMGNISYLVQLQKKFKQASIVRGNQLLLGLGASQLARTDVMHCADADSQTQSKDLSSGGKTPGSVSLE